MYFPCTRCHGQYTPECDDICDYARVVKENKLMKKQLGTLEGWMEEHFPWTLEKLLQISMKGEI